MSGYILVDSPNPNTPQGVYPRRGGAQLSGTCIVHTSEGPWRAGVDALTRLVRTRADHGCYHQACDWEDIARYYPWEWETWQDSETNNWAVGIAAACKTTDWEVMPADVREGFYRNMAQMAADFVTYMASKGVTVPLRRLTGWEARAGVPGFCAHGDSGVYRTDPGSQFEWTKFFTYTAQALGSAAITTQGTITPEEDDMYTEEDRKRDNRQTQILEAMEADNLRNVTKYIKGDAEETLYEIIEETGQLRGISLVEWQASGRGYRTVPQSVINALPKVGASNG